MKFRPKSTGIVSLALAQALLTGCWSATESVTDVVAATVESTNNAVDIAGLRGLVFISGNNGLGSDYSTDPALFPSGNYANFNNGTDTASGANNDNITNNNKSKGYSPSGASSVKRPPPVRAFVDSLSSTEDVIHADQSRFSQNYIIPDGTGPLRWSCVYNKDNVVMTPQGTDILITRSDGREIQPSPKSHQPAHPGRPFSCGEMIVSKSHGIGYGKYSVDMISTDLRGHVTALFLITHGAAGTGSEIDIELTGIDSTVVWMTVWQGTKQDAVKVPLGFDASKGWHNYAVEWTPESIVWSVDGNEVLRKTDVWTADPRDPGVEYQLAMNSWTHDVEDRWAGRFEWPVGRTQPVMGQFRNLRFVPLGEGKESKVQNKHDQ